MNQISENGSRDTFYSWIIPKLFWWPRERAVGECATVKRRWCGVAYVGVNILVLGNWVKAFAQIRILLFGLAIEPFVLQKILGWKAFYFCTEVVYFSDPHQLLDAFFIRRLVVSVKKFSEGTHPGHIAGTCLFDTFNGLVADRVILMTRKQFESGVFQNIRGFDTER